MLRSQWLWVAALLALMGLALAFRLPRLAERPMHCDEANQAVKTGILYDKGKYAYDPREHHGPTLYYLTLPVLKACGVPNFAASTESMYRIVPVVFGVGLIGLLWLLRDALGPGAMIWAALFTAVSHAMVYYSRYYIQEMLFVFFTLGFLAAGWRYWNRPSLAWAFAWGLFAGLMHATKETCVVVFAGMAAAWVITAGWTWLRDGFNRGEGPRQVRVIHGVMALGAGAGISVLFFSSFFTHARGPLDSLLTFTTYLHRAEGAGSTALHEQPWYYYLQTLFYTYRSIGPRWSEGLIAVLAVLGAVSTGFARTPARVNAAAGEGSCAADTSIVFHRFLSIYTVLILVLFSMIPYKTPWNALIFLHPMILVAGIGAARFICFSRFLLFRAVLALVVLGGAGQLAYQTYQGNFLYAADTRNPYVYAHTSTALMRLVTRVDEIAAVSPEHRRMQINIIKPDGDYWPLPWYLRRYERVGYWPKIPHPADAPMIIADPRLQAPLKEALDQTYMEESHALRPGVFLYTCIRQDLWDAFIKTRQ